MSFQLVCNHKNCLKPISNVGWVTACSHIFCEDHGKQLKLRWESMTCPACGTHFEEEFAINERVVNPSKEFKSSDLLGLKPDIVLQIASDAINFWTHQCSLQMKMMRHKLDQYRSTLITTKSELEKNKESYDNMIRKIHTKLYDANKRIRQLSLEVSEKDRQITKFQRTRCGFCS